MDDILDYGVGRDWPCAAGVDQGEVNVRVPRVHPAIPPFDRLRDHSSIPISVCEATACSGSPGRPNTRRGAALPWTDASAMACLARLCARVFAIASILLICAVPYGAAVAESAAAAVRAVTQMSNRFAAFVDEASERFSVPVNWIGSVINIESAGDAHARSPKGAMGLMQIIPSTWAELRERHNLGRDPYDPRDNVLAGTAYLRELLDRYGGPAYLPRTMRDQLATKSISRAAHCQTRRKRMWPSLQLCLASSCLRRGPPAGSYRQLQRCSSRHPIG